MVTETASSNNWRDGNRPRVAITGQMVIETASSDKHLNYVYHITLHYIALHCIALNYYITLNYRFCFVPAGSVICFVLLANEYMKYCGYFSLSLNFIFLTS